MLNVVSLCCPSITEYLATLPAAANSFFNMIDSNHYTFRLSRIDLCCDFVNENINIAKLKRSIEDGRTEIRYGKY